MSYWEKNKMHDAHTHINDKEILKFLKEKNFPCIINAANKQEYEFLKKNQYSNMYISCGIHPWYVQTTNINEVMECIKEANFLGEIGLDHPWCESPFELQKEIFLYQLSHISLPTVLHTKGYEKEVLDIIRLFPRKYLVHWYSCKEFIDDYIQLDCYFTIGPSVINDDAVKEVARKVPLNRILIETDGLEAVEWALGTKIDYTKYEECLETMIKVISDIKNISVNELKTILMNNFDTLTCN